MRVYFDPSFLILEKIQRKPVAWAAVYAKAENLSHRVAVKQVCRSFDLLHVAIAVVSAVKRFATLDEQQVAVARSAGLKVIKLATS